MYKIIDASSLSNNSTLKINCEIPRVCPHCNHGMEPRTCDALFLHKDLNIVAYVLFFCPHCEKCFMATYHGYYSGGHSSEMFLSTLAPYSFIPMVFSDGINDISADFVSIYNQALQAEREGLKDICGIAYRKALEFLIKDFCIHLHPDEADSITKLPLAKCIDAYIESSRIKALAKASAWLGNDETHYTRKHPDYGIDDLKAFINATVSFIDSELDYLRAQSLLDSKKSQQ